jgi:hypothetical protein
MQPRCTAFISHGCPAKSLLSDHDHAVRFGQLPKVERKVITKMTNKAATKVESILLASAPSVDAAIQQCPFPGASAPELLPSALLVLHSVLQEEDHGAICTQEIGAMLKCFEYHSFRTTECWPQIKTMYACTEAHGGDPVSLREACGNGGAAAPIGAAGSTQLCFRPMHLPRIMQDPRIMARQWQGGLRQRVFQFFVNKRVLSRGR